MPIFKYIAYDAKGKQVSGEVEATNETDAKQKLTKDSLFPKEISLNVQEDKKDIFTFDRIGLSDLLNFSHELSTLLRSGSSLYNSFEIIIKENENKKFRNKLIDIKERIAEGTSLSNALAQHSDVFSEMFIRMVEAGEESGTLDTVLTRLAEYLEAKNRTVERVKTAFIYPALMTVVGIGVLSFLFIFVIPKILTVFEDTEASLPMITIVLVAIVNFFKNYWILSLVVIVALMLLFDRYIKTEKGRVFFDEKVLTLPWAGTVLKKFYIATLARTLGSLLECGLPILKAIEMTKNVLNQKVYEKILEKTLNDVREGVNLSATLTGSSLIPGLFTHMISIGEKSGNLSDLLIKSAENYEREFNIYVDRSISLLEPILILLMGAIVGFVVMAVLLPIFQLNTVLT